MASSASIYTEGMPKHQAFQNLKQNFKSKTLLLNVLSEIMLHVQTSQTYIYNVLSMCSFVNLITVITLNLLSPGKLFYDFHGHYRVKTIYHTLHINKVSLMCVLSHAFTNILMLKCFPQKLQINVSF